MCKFFFLIFNLTISANGFSQVNDTVTRKPDSLTYNTDSTGYLQNNTSEGVYTAQTKITFRTYFVLLGSDLKQGFTKPINMCRKDWRKFGVFALATGALSFADQPVQKQIIKLRNNNPDAFKVSKYVTNFGGVYELYTLAALGTYGLIFKNEKLKTTTLLATQAYVTGAAFESVFKFLSGRRRPSFYNPYLEAKPTFTGPFGNTSPDYNGNKTGSSFPSGHATVAFAAATVYAMEYKSTIWVPILSYTAASLISLSRITENKHWTTDVFAGAVLGYFTGRLAVNNYHRYAKLKAQGMPKNSVTFNLQYNYKQLKPGLIYHIR
jgi:membrane-associated phospholipid phosphatase